MLKILVADDHAIIRDGLKQILEDTVDIRVTAQAKTGMEVLDQVHANDFDLVLLDIAMPGLNGLDVLKELKSEKPELPILVLSMYPEEQYALRVLRAGASGYMNKESATEDLLSAIRKITTGGTYVSPALAETLATHLQPGAAKEPHQTLSDREYQVMCMIASGKTARDIAEELALSEKTVATYRARVLTKMNLACTADLVRYALENRLVP